METYLGRQCSYPPTLLRQQRRQPAHEGCHLRPFADPHFPANLDRLIGLMKTCSAASMIAIALGERRP